MYKGLVIGCGSIGAEYDFNNDKIQTHAKAMALHPEISLCVADIDLDKAAQVAKKYDAAYLTVIDDTKLAEFDIVSVCVATKYHFEYLQRLSRLNIPFIICEKPVVSSLAEISALHSLQLDPDRILVNYIRRFQPGFALLKNRLSELLSNKENNIQHLVVRYQRGFLNNCSHALDLLSFLLDTPIKLEHVGILKYEYDAFPTDPTLTLQALFNNIPLSLLGFPNSGYSIFEIDIFTKRNKISITDSGNCVKYFGTNEDGRLVENPALLQENILEDYMKVVMAEALTCLTSQKKTNFASALSLNEQMLHTLQLLQK
ncbi:MAG: Gfo/Idh/MocA family oxidoreductase [Chitinophagaceae bacterium]